MEFPQPKLPDHQSSGHDAWNLLPLEVNPPKAPFQELGYSLSTERARDLSLDQAHTIHKVREQVSKTDLMVHLEGSVENPRRIKLQHCYEDLANCIADAIKVKHNEIEQLLLMPTLDFDPNLEPGVYDYIFSDDESSFTKFILKVANAKREHDGEPRALLFLCKVFLWQES